MSLRHFITILVLSIATWSNAQSERLLDQLLVDEQNAIEAIALYPEKERLAILEASSHPEVLVRIQNLQIKTSNDFQELVTPLNESEQRAIYNLSRYPDLIQSIADAQRRNSNRKMDELLEGYPDDVKVDAKHFNNKHYDIITKIELLYRNSDQAFTETLAPYSNKVKQAYQELLRLPEILSILTNNLNMSVLLGDMYKEDPEKVKSELDSLNIVVAEQKAKELKEWQESLQNDPEALAEYEAASREFAAEQGYSETDYDRESTDPYTSDVTVHYIWQPYPYWFGCPPWYPYNCWYPYPYWYHWGYYYGPGNVIVFIGMPSYYFVHWYYNSYDYYHHFHRYPRFTNHLINYHHHHPKANTSVGTLTGAWVREYEDKLPKKWLKDDGGRIERIKEFGKFKADYENAVRNGDGKVITERDFLKQHEDNYPNMRPILKEKPEIQTKPDQPIRKVPVERPKTEKSKVITRPETERQKIERAKSHHENTWERSRPPRQQRPVVRPPSRPTQPTKRPPVRKPVRPSKRGG